MKKHHQPGPAPAAPGAIKTVLCGALLALWLCPGAAVAQTLAEPPPVESFSLEAGQPAPAGDDAVADLYNELVEGAAPPPAPTSGAAPLPPGTPLHSQNVQRNQAAPALPSVSGNFSDRAPAAAPSGAAADPNAANPFPPPAQNTPSPFPPVSPSEAATDPFAPAPAGASAAVPLGQGAALPQPDWQSVSGPVSRPPSQFVSDAPEPQFDASQGQWMELEIGQTDRAGAPPPAAAGPPASVPTVAAPAPPSDVDALMDSVAAPGPASIRTPEGRDNLRSLFSDMTPSNALEAPTEAGQTGQAAPPVPNFSALPPSTAPGQPAPAEDYEGSSAILKAGGLLGQEESYGNAEILPPLTDAPPAKAAAPTAAKPAAAPAKQPAKQPAKATPVKTPAPKKARQAAPRAATGTLAIINETGNPRVGDIYRSVLSRLGHQVVSVAQGAAGGTPGQTVIRYAPGRRAQAQAVARQLPGKKVLTEAGSGTPDVTIYIR